jgi:hypothetical protein
MHIHAFGDNILQPKSVLVMNEKMGRSVEKDTRTRQEDQVGISPSVFLYLT